MTAPQAGDLVVYRDGGGQVSHTGIVYSAVPGGLVLVESKWGKGGRFIHPVDAQPYPGPWTYYRADRPGHLLRGLGDEPARPTPPTPMG